MLNDALPAGQYAGIQVNIRWAEEGKWLCFRNPLEVFHAANPKEIVSILGHIEKEVEEKKIYAAGFLAYEAGAAFDSAFSFRPGGDFPLLWFGLFKEAEQCAAPVGGRASSWSPVWQNSVTKEEYTRAIQSIKSYIVQGATYQVNYTYRLRAPFAGDALSYFLQIAGASNVPYAAFVDSGRYAICSFSPELFFNLKGDRITSKPMKGTMPRGLLFEDDYANSQQLYSSEKNRAENIMIVDMVRNDFGRIAVPGTVVVSSLYDVEKFDTVWQMTSTVQAKTSVPLAQIFQALFPPASITGAPKVRTTQIIAELEKSPRRIYTGSIGFMAPGRRAQFNVAIRTLLVDKVCHEAEYGVGGGIVWDSVDTAEYDECAVKAKIVIFPTVDFELLETVLWTPVENYFLLDLHLVRMKSSAAYFSFPLEEESLRKKLSSLASELPPVPHRVRLLLNREGKIICEAKPYGEIPDNTELFVCLAKHSVASGDVFLYHKTTNRLVYDNAKALRPGYDEVILWNEKGEVTEFCTGNIVVEMEGEMLTPPVNCGLLPGTFRQWLLKKGFVKERVITLEMLGLCEKVHLCNSVKKMQEVRVDLNT